jgi:hypothetical protein
MRYLRSIAHWVKQLRLRCYLDDPFTKVWRCPWADTYCFYNPIKGYVDIDGLTIHSYPWMQELAKRNRGS